MARLEIVTVQHNDYTLHEPNFQVGNRFSSGVAHLGRFDLTLQ